MTSNVKLLPLPGLPNIGAGGQWLGWSDDDMRDYARACVANATAAKDSEIEALRAEVQRLQALTKAEHAAASGDVVAMLRSYDELKWFSA